MKAQKVNNMNNNQPRTIWQRVTNPFEKKATKIINTDEIQDANLEFLRRMNIRL